LKNPINSNRITAPIAALTIAAMTPPLRANRQRHQSAEQ
jgi:hypothetical protein